MAATHVNTARKPLRNPKTLVSQPTDPPHNTLWRWNEIQGGRESSHTVTYVISPQLGSSKLVLGFNIILENEITNKFSYSQSTSRVTSIFEIWTEFWNLHAGLEHQQRDFRVPVEIFPKFDDGIKLRIFLNITALSISKMTIVFQVFLFSVHACFLEIFPEKYSRFHTSVWHLIQRESRMFISFSKGLGFDSWWGHSEFFSEYACHLLINSSFSSSRYLRKPYISSQTKLAICIHS